MTMPIGSNGDSEKKPETDPDSIPMTMVLGPPPDVVVCTKASHRHVESMVGAELVNKMPFKIEILDTNRQAEVRAASLQREGKSVWLCL